MFRLLVEDQLSRRQITKRLIEANTPPPRDGHQFWHASIVRKILKNRVYMGQARYNCRQPAEPKYRKTAEAKLRYLKTGRSYRPDTEWVWTEAPVIISGELFEKAQLQLQRNAEAARKMYQPASRRYLLRGLCRWWRMRSLATLRPPAKRLQKV